MREINAGYRRPDGWRIARSSRTSFALAIPSLYDDAERQSRRAAHQLHPVPDHQGRRGDAFDDVMLRGKTQRHAMSLVDQRVLHSILADPQVRVDPTVAFTPPADAAHHSLRRDTALRPCRVGTGSLQPPDLGSGAPATASRPAIWPSRHLLDPLMSPVCLFHAAKAAHRELLLCRHLRCQGRTHIVGCHHSRLRFHSHDQGDLPTIM